MESPYTIGRLASEAGVAVSTVRYYERSHLLSPSGRTEGNYRIYDREALERLRFIRAAQSIGFSLADVSTLLDVRAGSAPVCRDVQTLIERRLTETKKRLAELRHLRNALRAALRTCHGTDRRGHCAVIDGLDASASIRPVRS